MTTLTQAHRQWASRPADERFTSLTELQSFAALSRQTSRSKVVSTREIELIPDDGDHKGLLIGDRDGIQAAPTHWSFGQLCSLASTPSPASYFRESGLPTPIIADCLNHNLRFTRGVEDVKLLVSGQGNGVELRAAIGPRYGRIWNADVVDALVERFGDGVSGHWRVPGIFGERITVDKGNTTLYASDRDMFVFLADEDRRIEIPNRRNGQPGSLARGFFVWNSEVGNTTLGAGFFLFDYVCCNRYVWGADQYTEVRIRNTSGAPDRWIEEVTLVLREYAEGSAKPVLQAIEDARSKRIGVVPLVSLWRLAARGYHVAKQDDDKRCPAAADVRLLDDRGRQLASLPSPGRRGDGCGCRTHSHRTRPKTRFGNAVAWLSVGPDRAGR
jgi:hypothetical protein